jgi:predicted anti-sigma-YlaC factor YlaD
MEKMNCERYRHLFSDFIDNELSEDQIMDFKNHIKICSSCKEEFTNFARSQEILKLLSKKEVNPDLWNVIEERVKKIENSKLLFFSKSYGVSASFKKERSNIIRIYGTSYGIAKQG